jgi:predicted dehydrogenase
MKRIGLVGFGGYAAVYRRLIAQAEAAGLCQLTAVAVPEEQYEQAAAAYRGTGVALYRSFKDLLAGGRESGIEMLLLPVPIDLHADFAVSALQEGYHILLEKPIAANLLQADQIQKATENTRRQVAIGFQYMYDPGMLELKRLALENCYGRLREIRIKVLWARGQKYYRRTYWAGKLAAEGRPVNDCPLNNAAAHFLQSALFLSGREWDTAAEPEKIYAENYRANDIESADTQFARIHTRERVTVSAIATHACPRELEPEVMLIFERGRAVWKNGTIEVSSLEGSAAASRPKSWNGEQLRRLMLEDFLHAVGTGRQPWSSLSRCHGHTAAISGILAPEFPVRSVTEAYLKIREGIRGPGYTGGEPGNAVVIEGIETAAERCYREGTGFSEAGAVWAV